ncbi:MAG: hypothetical protein CVU51_05850 [Deltaproteobacteria bacterium HGW-Deltaproteobacteria-1]|nr:MAG: hypothetical protein CVU51_05850 [Deltaproteobacteria bacterium HGW-Deltaproteobacteria-1]
MALSSDIGILFLLFLLSGFFASAEAALLSLTDLHLHKMKSDNYPFFGSVVKLLENPRRLLITIVTGNEAVNISISILAASLFISLFGAKGQWISIVATSVVLFLAGEAIPKTFGVTYPMRISSAVAPLLLVFSRLEYPVVAALEKTPALILNRLDKSRAQDSDVLMEDEFKNLIDAGIREGVVDESQKELIKTIFESGDRPVTDIMIPRVDMFCLSSDMKTSDIVHQVVHGRYERVPVYREDRDDIIGILFGDDLPASCGCDIIDNATMIVPGIMPMEQVNDLLQAALPLEEFDTIGGFVLHLFGRMPERGEMIHFENYHFRIESVGRTRILKIRIEKEKQTETEGEA